VTVSFAGDVNYNNVADMTAKLTIESNATNPVKKDIQKSDGKVGIRLVSGNVVSEKADMQIVLANDKVSQVKIVIYDNVGNVVFERTQNNANVTWNLTNSAGRNVANGTYLIVAEVKGSSGKTYAYSAKLGVKR
jgi:flagellar hook assembly protein FlgD